MRLWGHKWHIKHLYQRDFLVNAKYQKEQVEVDDSLEFEGAVFNLNRQDISMLVDQGIQVTLDTKKIYCYIDVDLKNKIEFEGNNYIVTTAKNYMKHDELRIYYIERVQE